MEKLSKDKIANSMENIAGWTLTGDVLYKEFKFNNFIEAFGFMSKVALIAESMQHHPDWSNVYSTVKIKLHTHDVGGLSEKDFVLAQKIDRIL